MRFLVLVLCLGLTALLAGCEKGTQPDEAVNSMPVASTPITIHTVWMFPSTPFSDLTAEYSAIRIFDDTQMLYEDTEMLMFFSEPQMPFPSKNLTFYLYDIEGTQMFLADTIQVDMNNLVDGLNEYYRPSGKSIGLIVTK